MSAMNIAVVGAQWGDEGKGKIVDLLTPAFSVVARYQGGHNAGHTVFFNDRKFILHLVPSGILHSEVICVIGNGAVIDPRALFAELEELRGEGIETSGRLIISNRAHVILPYHQELDQVAETARGDRKIGTTSRGIGPTYEDKSGRRGIRIGDLSDSTLDGLLAQTLQVNVANRNKVVAGPPLDWTKILAELKEAWNWLEPLVGDVSEYLTNTVRAGRRILFEGAQGTMLDVDHGTYPYVSSSNGTIGGVCTGLGVGPRLIDGVLGVLKAYTTRVGEGPFPTEIIGEAGDKLRENGKEFGASTGRPRRCGWYDSVVARYAARINGLEALALTKLDVLDGMPELKICTAYHCDGELLTEFPENPSKLARCSPAYETLPGWSLPVAGVRHFNEFPVEAMRYVERLEEAIGVPIGIVSTGSDREDTIIRRDSIVEGWVGR